MKTLHFERIQNLRAAIASLVCLAGVTLPIQAQNFAPCTTGSPNLCAPANSNVGIGSTAPLGRLHVNGATVLGTYRAYAPDRFTGGILFDGYDFNNGSNYDYVSNIVSMPETWTGNGNGSLLRFLTAPSSTAAPVEALRITKTANVGIGTPAPLARLHINGATVLGSHRTYAADRFTGGILFDGYDFNNGANYDYVSNIVSMPETWTGNGNGSLLRFLTAPSSTAAPVEALRITKTGNVGIGTTAPQYKLAVNGTIGAKEVIVTNTGWADYVFAPTYRLTPLAEVAEFIAENHHLPEIPSEAEASRGVGIGEMQTKLLAKIEELTLHMIRAEERSNRLEDQNADLREENRRMQERVNRIEALAAKKRD